ncbi:hypothetical protein BKA66DRAFT_572699 [Pyrenochaeta sp. MPI-SDFR-AT-0127]|nr:hypothetical protein BKA66DRAFT_572699 [Pyrenochaeta sp. MPI-SDFR-AT-0127]
MDKVIAYIRGAPSQNTFDCENPSARTAPRDVYLCGPNVVYDGRKDVMKRLELINSAITIYGWPSRGGIIVLEAASPADFDFLHLNRINPPTQRYKTPEEEDIFCQKLLLLGAKWWDTVRRCVLLTSEETDILALDDSDEPLPTLRERYWVSVAWPSTGGMVVSEWDTNMYGVGIVDELVPTDVSRLLLCTNMDEKAEVLKSRFQGKHWGTVAEYQGNAFINCWSSKETGEVEQFQMAWPNT